MFTDDIITYIEDLKESRRKKDLQELISDYRKVAGYKIINYTFSPNSTTFPNSHTSKKSIVNKASKLMRFSYLMKCSGIRDSCKK